MKYLLLPIFFSLTLNCPLTSMAQTDEIKKNMVLVEGGTFTMGCTLGQGKDCEESEKYTKQVTVANFYISKYEVTVGEFKKFVDATGYPAGNYAEKGSDSSLPAVNVSWEDAQAYCKWAGVRLPTEAEWEYAARGGKYSTDKKYAGANSLEGYAWYAKNSGGKTHLVGITKPNELGLYDMSGNVWEWCSDWYADNYEYYPPSSGSSRAIRGGSWGSSTSYMGISFRATFAPDHQAKDAGFRVCLSL